MDRERKVTQKRSWKNRRGFTLAEVMIASTFFSLLFLAIFSTVSSASTILQMQILHAGINQGGAQMLRYIGREIVESSPITDQNHLILATDVNNNSIVTFQVPVDWDGDIDVVQNSITQTVEWGAYRFVREPSQQSWLNGWVRYSVVNNQLLREVLTSANGAILATEVVIPGDVLSFTVTLNNRRLSILLTIRKTDTVNQKGANAQTYQVTFDGDLLLRNGG